MNNPGQSEDWDDLQIAFDDVFGNAFPILHLCQGGRVAIVGAVGYTPAEREKTPVD
jgi:hypothetical protein